MTEPTSSLCTTEGVNPPMRHVITESLLLKGTSAQGLAEELAASDGMCVVDLLTATLMSGCRIFA